MDQKVEHSGKVGVEGQSVVRFEFVESADGKPADQEAEADEAGNAQGAEE